MPAFWSSSAKVFAGTETDVILATLARGQVWHFRTTEAEQMPAWRDMVETLRAALPYLHSETQIILEYPMLRLGRRIDCVLLTRGAILVLEFKRAEAGSAALAQVEDYALDLFDFHEASRQHPIIPVLVTEGAQGSRISSLRIPGVSAVEQARPRELGPVLADLLRHVPEPARNLDASAWEHGAYRPVPTIIEAACMLYGRNGVAEIAAARADQRNLHATTDAIRTALAEAQLRDRKIILFVTGIPGAGKTLCGLNAAFGATEDMRGTFLTGNPTLVHVLRAALRRDAVDNGADRTATRRRMESVIQALPRFRTHYLERPYETPAERVLVIDEAQRCWSRDYAIRKTRDKPIPLTQSEPAHLLDIAGRHEGFSAIICLVGSGQEIHDGEGGLAEWGVALRTRSEWHVRAAPEATGAADARWKLGEVPSSQADPLLHLDVPIRQIRSRAGSDWVNAVLRGDEAGARSIAEESGGLPYYITRDLDELRRALRGLARGHRRAGLLASSGAARLRAEGLGAELPHMDENAVARWFLDRFPKDVRASDALEQVATEFSCQGLELDVAGLCWDADLIRQRGTPNWQARNFVGTKWQIMRREEAIANQLNTYRVLLTRARYETAIFIPRGCTLDPTRTPPIYDHIAAFLSACGARSIGDLPLEYAAPSPALEPALL